MPPIQLLSPHPTARLGFLLLETDHGSDREISKLIPPDVQFNISRIPSYTGLKASEWQSRAVDAARLLLPGTRLDAIGYGCTSGSFGAAGDLADEIFVDSFGSRWVSVRSALFAALHEMSTSRIGLLSPYVGSLNADLAEELEGRGIHVTSHCSFELEHDEDIARVSPEALTQAAGNLLARPDVECLVIACNAMPVVGVVEELESRWDKPVLTSNQVLTWYCLRVGGYHENTGVKHRIFHPRKADQK